MLKFDLERLLELREVQNPRTFLLNQGFSYHMATRLLKGELGSPRHLERLCLALNCTPDDLFSWLPDKDLRSPKQYALHKLSGRQRKGSLLPKLKSLPEDKLNQVHELVNKLMGGE